jgi:hypothetical protein
MQTGKYAFLSFNLFITPIIEKTVSLQENVDPELLTSMREGVPMQLTGIPSRKEQENDAIPKIAPKWLKYDRQVSVSSFKESYLKLTLFDYLNLIFKLLISIFN